MILHSVSVKNWRALREPLELANLSPGLNLIHGPNETGKSTVMDAICRGFYDRHNTGGEDMKSRQPWGSSLGPRVEIEFALDGQRYQLRKQFLEDRSCELSQWRDRRWERIAEGRQADEQIIELVAGDATGRGMTKPEHWGLGQVLWAPQGDATQLCVGENQQARLRSALKITLDGTQGEAIEQAIQARYDAIYTPTGQLRRGERNKPELVRLQEEAASAEQEVAVLRQHMEQVEQDAHDLAAAEDEHDQTKTELNRAQEDLKAGRKRLEELSKQQRAYEKLQSEAEKASREWKAINDRVNAISQADDAVKNAAGKLKAELSKAEQVQERRKRAEERLGQARDARRSAVVAQGRCEKATAAAGRKLKWLEITAELADVRQQHEQAAALQTQFDEREQELEKLAAPTDAQVKALRELNEKLQRKQAELDAASLSVRIEPQRSLSLGIEKDGEAEEDREGGDLVELSAISRLSIDIRDVGRVIIRGGQTDAAQLAEELEDLVQKWAKQTAVFGTQDLGQLEQLQTRRKLLEQGLKDLKKQVKPGAVARLAARIETLEAEKKALLVEDPPLAELDQTQAEAKQALRDAQSQEKQAREYAGQAERDVEQAQEQVDKAREAAATSDSEISAARATVQHCEAEARDRREADGLSDETRRKALLSARQLADAAQQRLEAAEKPPTEDMARDLEQIDEQCQDLNRQLTEQVGRISVLKSQVAEAGGEGLYSQLAKACERLDDLRQQRDREQLEADAVRLLWETIRQYKQEVFDATLKPVQQLVTATMQRLAGPRYERINFDENLTPTSVEPRAREAQATVQQLSFGTREQLMLSVRLAMARLLADDGERQCVILDDPLVNADRARQRAALRILEDAEKQTQILVFTCHPTAYQGLRDVASFDLEALVKQDGASEAAWKDVGQ